MPLRLLETLTTLARTIGGELAWFADRMAGLTPDPQAQPAPHPVCETLAARCVSTTSLTQPATQALLNAAPHLPWTQSYTESDGFDAHYLANYAFVNVISPKGLFLSDDMRVSIGFWGEGLRYPDHAHAPEEWYVMLAGSCTLTSDGVGTRVLRAGQIAHHAPWQRHAADMRPGPLLAAAFWRGDGLMDKSTFYDTPMACLPKDGMTQ